MVKIVAMGDNVVDCYLSRETMFPGGNCLNASVFIRKFGGTSAYVGAIGRDPAGDCILAALTKEGVDTSRLRRLDGPTAYCVIGHRNADRVFVTFDLGISMFEPTEGDFEFLSGCDAVHIGQSSGLDVHLARVAGLRPLSYDFSNKYDKIKIERIAPLCFLASASAETDEQQDAVDLMGAMLASGATWCLVTRGSKGAILGSDAGIFEIPAAKVDVVDTLGAGDTFIARTLFGLVKGEAPMQLLSAAAIEAADTCSYHGAVGYGVPIDLAIDVDAIRLAHPDL
ncbi:PfkB family carbohydrate kinase [Rhizobium grahamii]|uniref:Ribokinase-like domain-containing protein n=2 Tax=Rhizobium grahamii TaxID=1120045 RepID=S3HC62_9HYPH|nr:PfkB family carbohydrate kinase [Rhizobium grahamii]EPE96307.1 ribokinase-like domain-containing protein [Rhizobium grahamii CCGE 502]RDJ02900.1 ribokinase [Rhizobium grahamii]